MWIETLVEAVNKLYEKMPKIIVNGFQCDYYGVDFYIGLSSIYRYDYDKEIIIKIK